MAENDLDAQIAADAAAGKRFVRTFASDMSALQGGAPPAAPAPASAHPQGAEAVKIVAEQVLASEPVVPKPPAQVSGGAELSGYIHSVAGGGEKSVTDDVLDLDQPQREATAAERLIAASPIREEPLEISPAPVPAPTPSPTPAPVPKRTAVSPIETYASDFSKRMKETNASTATILAAEQDAAAASTGAATAGQEKKKGSAGTLIAVIAGVTLIVLGAVGVYVVYGLRASSTATAPIIAPALSTPIFVDSSAQVSGTGANLLAAVAQESQKAMPANTVRQLTLATSTTNDNNVFLALGLRLPDILSRNIEATGGMAGVIRTQDGQSPFFILKVDSYSATFSGMLAWEPNMPADLAALFPAYPAEATTTATTATSTQTAAPAQVARQAAFEDETMSNHDVRVYRDAQNRVVMLYGYWNPSTLVIARDQSAFDEIVTRLQTSHAQ